MTQEEKQLLAKDIFGRVLTGLKVDYKGQTFTLGYNLYLEEGNTAFESYPMKFYLDGIESIKPYLRPMSSMTEEELKELNDKYGSIAYFFIQDPPYYHGLQAQHSDIGSIEISEFSEIYDWLDANHFDYHIVPSTGKTLIESNLALEAPADMYKS